MYKRTNARPRPRTTLSAPTFYNVAHHPGALALFRYASWVLIVVYIIGGIIEYMYNASGANVGDTPVGYVMPITFIIGNASVAMLMAGLKGVAELIRETSDNKALIYGSLMSAWAVSSTFYAVITSVFFDGPTTEKAFGPALGYLGRLPLAFIAAGCGLGMMKRDYPGMCAARVCVCIVCECRTRVF